MSEKLSLLSCFGFQTLGSRYGSLNHRSQTIWFSFTESEGGMEDSASFQKVVGGIVGRNGQNGLWFRSGQSGSRSVDACSFGRYASMRFTRDMCLHVMFQILVVVGSHKEEMALKI
ncbi:hypothetical protein V6N13_088091 [Hibiscus sabdariffa]